MEKVNQYVSLVNQAYSAAKDSFNNQESVKKAEEEKEALVNSLQKDSFIKTPVRDKKEIKNIAKKLAVQ